MPVKKQKTPDYLSNLGISPQVQQQIQQYYQPGGGFAQSMAANMVPTGQGGYTAKPQQPLTGGGPIVQKPPTFTGGMGPQPVGQPIQQAPGFKTVWNGNTWVPTLNGQPVGPGTQTGGNAGQPPQMGGQSTTTPAAGSATMDWSGLMNKLEGILTPFLGGSSGVVGGTGPGGAASGTANPMQSIMGALMPAMMNLMGQFNPAGNQTTTTPPPPVPQTGGGQPYSLAGGAPSYFQAQ